MIANMSIRRKILKCFVLIILLSILLFYGIGFLIYVNRQNLLASILRYSDSCPICFGDSACTQLYANQVILEGFMPNTFQTQTTYFGRTIFGIRVVLKRLGTERELRELDANICKIFELNNNCKPTEALVEELLAKKITASVAPEFKRLATEPVKGLVMCPFAKKIFDLVMPLVRQTTPRYEYDLMYIWTTLTVNPEPIMLQLMPRAEGWPVPTFGGVCGRLEIASYEGEPISSLANLDFRRKLKFAKGILEAAMDFTYKHDLYRFYLMDWSTENIVVNEHDEITFVDLEDFVVVDKTMSPNNLELPHWLNRHGIAKKRGTSLYEHLCQHQLSDHNIWEACNVLAGDKPLLYPLPEHINRTNPSLDTLMQNCLHDGTNRFRTAIRLKRVIREILTNKAM